MSTKTIVLAEDEAELANSIDAALRYRGFRVRLARDETEVMTCVAQGNGDSALVLLDTTISRRDGMETLREIRRVNPRVPVIVFSGVSSPATIVEAIKNGATDFLAKPLAYEQLLRAVHKATRNGTGPGPEEPAHPAPCSNPRMQAIHAALRQIALSDVPVVLRGESGVGKEVLAREIHAQSPRSAKPFLKINCAALPLELLESELFGYERGAFTGAVKSTPGKFEVADGGMILLDEIGDMDFKLQAKLLHVLQDSEFQRLGGHETVRVNVRVLAATHCDLEQAIAEKRFREDLYYRLNVISIQVPPLRERKDEILPLAGYFLEKHAGARMPAPAITPGLEEALLAHSWPGNIRELENVIRKFLVFGDPAAIIEELRQRNGAGRTALEEVNEARNQEEARTILEALNRTHWNRKKAAALLQIDYKGLLYKMKKLGVSPDQVRSS